MNTSLCEESERLRGSWDRHPREHLDRYLVSDVEDPRINFQSVLTRALIVDALFPGKFSGLIDAEQRFGLAMTWLYNRLREGHNRWDMLDALNDGDHSVFPEFMTTTYQSLQNTGNPILDYLTEALFRTPLDEDRLVSGAVLDTFASVWNQTLAPLPRNSISLIEPACGSANDYRYLAHYGLAPFVNYSGFDISRKNIANARKRFPDVNFYVGNVFQIPADDRAFEYLFVHDLFEHLSPEGLDRAINESLRVTRKKAWLSFFNMDRISEHRFQAVGNYHWNTLSLGQTMQMILRRARSVEVVDISELAKEKYGYADYYNKRAMTLIVEN